MVCLNYVQKYVISNPITKLPVQVQLLPCHRTCEFGMRPGLSKTLPCHCTCEFGMRPGLSEYRNEMGAF